MRVLSLVFLGQLAAVLAWVLLLVAVKVYGRCREESGRQEQEKREAAFGVWEGQGVRAGEKGHLIKRGQVPPTPVQVPFGGAGAIV